MLPAQMQFNVPTIGCAQLDKRPAGVDHRPEAAGGRLRGRRPEVPARPGQGARHRRHRRRRGQLDQTSASGWSASTSPATARTSGPQLTREASTTSGSACDQTALGQDGKCRVAVVLDNEIVSAPGDPGRADRRLADHRQLHQTLGQRAGQPAALRRAAGDLRRRRSRRTSPPRWAPAPAGRPARRRHRHAAGRHLRVLLLPAARLGHLPEPGAVRRCWSSARWWCSAGRSASR